MHPFLLMKLPSLIQNILNRKPKPREVFLSLVLDTDSVQMGTWSVEDGKLTVNGSSISPVKVDTWDGRAEAVDRALTTLEDKTGLVGLQKVVLGLPAVYLTPEGDIEKSVRKEIKDLMQAMELTPIGFAPIHQALLFKLKRDEGVPPSAIFIGVTKDRITIHLYKVGVLAGQTHVINDDQCVFGVEHFLKSLTDIEVLPSRMLCYGGDAHLLDEFRGELLRFPWPTKVNFLHFPKIEVLGKDDLVHSIALAGAKEMATALGIDEETLVNQTDKKEPVFQSPAPLVTKMHKRIVTPEVDTIVEKEEPEEEEKDDSLQTEDEEEQEQEQSQETQDEEEEESEASKKEPTDEETQNVVMVDPESLGFKKNVDVLSARESLPKISKKYKEEKVVLPDEEEKVSIVTRVKSIIPISLFGKIGQTLTQGGVFVKAIPLIGVILIIALLYYLYLWVVPKASVTVLVIPKTLSDTRQVTVNPTATVADSATNIIPGQKLEKSVSGESTLPVTGKKKVGDPAKGPMTIYNKSLSGRTFVKGTIFQSGTLSFTLDSDVAVASASESLSQGTTTYGKATGAVTAVEIGAQSNLSADTQFSVKGVGEGVVVGRNDQPLTGGASKEVTVVSRADYDALVKSLTDDLVGKAKAELGTSVTGGEKIIDATIQTTVTEKKFTEELDQQSEILHGKVTVTVTGFTYKEEDIRTLVQSALNSTLPQGYSFAPDKISATLTNAQVKKDGTIIFRATLNAVVLPMTNLEDIKKNITGKTILKAKEYLEKVNGVGGVEFSFQLSPTRDRLPLNENNISVSVAIQE